jgi:transcription factor SPT20
MIIGPSTKAQASFSTLNQCRLVSSRLMLFTVLIVEKGLLDEVRALRIPVDFIEIFDMAHVPYYEGGVKLLGHQRLLIVHKGCMIVESIDHRKPRLHNQQSTAKEPECIRVVLQPNAESFYADLCLLNAKNGGTWTDQEALEVESNILVNIKQTYLLEC